ncbi:MAG TPA: hypothetical protein VE973_01370 [Candidatus Limnocylindria bacterium]|nr:hypothetical protein [Candidatus Limnocylindria bacterium]
MSFKPKGSSYFDIQMLSDSSFISQGSLEKNTSVFTQKNKGPWDQQIDINNGKAFYYINTSSKAGPSPSAYLVGPTGVWLITLTDINLKDTFLQMVSSFSFLSSTSSSQDWKTYANSGLGFQLTLTDAWKGYKVEMQTMSSNFGSGTLLFKVPTKDKKYEDGSGWATLMKISVYNPDYWKILQQGDGPKPQLLGKDKYGFAFAADFWQDPPTDLQNVNFDFNKVTASFKLTK